MKFLLQIEVEAPEHTGNPDYPRAVHAIQRLQDWLKDARQVQVHYLMDTYAEKPFPFKDEVTKKAYQDAINQEINLIDRAMKTVREA